MRGCDHLSEDAAAVSQCSPQTDWSMRRPTNLPGHNGSYQIFMQTSEANVMAVLNQYGRVVDVLVEDRAGVMLGGNG